MLLIITQLLDFCDLGNWIWDLGKWRFWAVLKADQSFLANRMQRTVLRMHYGIFLGIMVYALWYIPWYYGICIMVYSLVLRMHYGIFLGIMVYALWYIPWMDFGIFLGVCIGIFLVFCLKVI